MRTRALTRRGTSEALPPLLDDAELERLHSITLQYRIRRRTRSLSGTGDLPALARGQGLEPHDTRPYQAGDDIRHIDWRATARSSRPVSKVFVQERAHHLFISLDRRLSMMFGTRRELKATTAARTAAILAFAAIVDRDCVTGMVFDPATHYFPPTRRLDGVLAFLRTAAAPPFHPARAVEGPGGVSADARTPARSASPGTPTVLRHIERATLYLISDFNDVLLGEAAIAQYLPARHQGERIALRIVDPAERWLAPMGTLRLAPPGGGAPVVIDTSDPLLRARYQTMMAERTRELRRQCDRHGVRLIEIANDRDITSQLDGLL
jgi:uncharacterized protein (DUF58 family)